MRRMLQFALFVCLFGLLSVSSLAVDAQTTLPETCEAFQQQAFNTFSTACGDAEFGEVCYGFNAVSAFTEQRNNLVPIQDFDPGEEISLDTVEALSTGGYDPAEGVWGLSLVELPALEVGGQLEPNLRYILFGDAEIVNVDEPPPEDFGQLQSFTFETTSTTPLCIDAPSHVLVQTDCVIDEPRRFRIEGADMRLEGTAVFVGGPERGFIQAFVIYGVLIIEPDRNREPGAQTEQLIVPAGFTTTAPINAGVSIESVRHVGEWSPIAPVIDSTLEALNYVEAIPQNLTYCSLETPLVRQTSGAGGTRTELRYLSTAPLEALIPYCTVANPPDWCDIYANAPWP